MELSGLTSATVEYSSQKVRFAKWDLGDTDSRTGGPAFPSRPATNTQKGFRRSLPLSEGTPLLLAKQ